MNVTMNSALLRLAVAVKAAELDGAKVCLYQNDVTPIPGADISLFTPADFGGYAPHVVTDWGDAFIDASGVVSSLGGLATFTCTGVAPSNILYGAYVTNADDDIIFAWRFDNPQNMSKATDQINVVPRFQYGQLPPPA